MTGEHENPARAKPTETKSGFTAMPGETYAVISEIIRFIDNEDRKRGLQRWNKNIQP
jgi:hypothetical protein